jgi:hypothetical protein
MNVAFDIDGTLDAFPVVFESLCAALMAAGHHVYIITGVEEDTVTKTDIANKTAYLTGLGFGKGTYTTLIVMPKPHDVNKAKEVAENDIELLLDNSVANVKACKGLCACLLLWNNKKKDDQ